MLNEESIDPVLDPPQKGEVEDSKFHDPPNTTNTIPIPTTNSDRDLATPRYTGSEANSIVDLSTTTAILRRIVAKQLELLRTGQIPQLSKQTETFMDFLVSIFGYLS